MKNFDNFHISAQNIECGYLIEPPARGGSNEYHNLCHFNVYICMYFILVCYRGPHGRLAFEANCVSSLNTV